MAKYRHFGIPTSRQSADEIYIESAKVYVTDPEAHPYNVEFLRFDADSDFNALVQKHPHVAFEVEDLDAAIAGKNVIIPPFNATPQLRCAFITDNEAVIELIQPIG